MAKRRPLRWACLWVRDSRNPRPCGQDQVSLLARDALLVARAGWSAEARSAPTTIVEPASTNAAMTRVIATSCSAFVRLRA